MSLPADIRCGFVREDMEGRSIGISPGERWIRIQLDFREPLPAICADCDDMPPTTKWCFASGLVLEQTDERMTVEMYTCSDNAPEKYAGFKFVGVFEYDEDYAYRWQLAELRVIQ